MKLIRSVQDFWEDVCGDENAFSMEHRAFNAVCGISIVLLVVILGINVFLGLVYLALMVSAFLVLLAVIYYFSRFRKQKTLAIGVFAGASYLMIAFNFVLNSGIDGPTFLYLLLTFILLITISPRRMHFLYLGLHVFTAGLLLWVAYYHPEWIEYSYKGEADRYIDSGMSFIVSLVFLFVVVNYLRNRYNREKNLATIRTLEVEKQNELIRDQNNKVEKLNADKDKLFSMISHDFRSPLNTIQTYLELLNSADFSEKERLDMQNKLLGLTKNTNSMLTNLLYWARSRMEGYKLSLQKISVGQVIKKSIKLNKMVAQQKEIDLTVSIEDDATINADPEALQAVLRNLTSNAIKFTPKGGKVAITTKKLDNKIEISVEDTGIGMSLEQQRKLFSEEVESTIGTNREKGTGLGLKICQDIVEGHGGNIWIQSNKEEGTIVTFSLPLEGIKSK